MHGSEFNFHPSTLFRRPSSFKGEHALDTLGHVLSFPPSCPLRSSVQTPKRTTYHAQSEPNTIRHVKTHYCENSLLIIRVSLRNEHIPKHTLDTLRHNTANCATPQRPAAVPNSGLSTQNSALSFTLATAGLSAHSALCNLHSAFKRDVPPRVPVKSHLRPAPIPPLVPQFVPPLNPLSYGT
jgi:hypothetical protein